MAPSGPPAKKIKYSMDSFSSPLKIIVGKEKKEFYIHKGLICSHSAFFKASCNERWKSGRTNTVTLEEDDPVAFEMFLTWILTGGIKYSVDYIAIPEECFDDETGDQCYDTQNGTGPVFDQRSLQLARYFVLGDVLEAPSFSNAIMDLLLAQSMLEFGLMGTDPKCLAYIYPQTSVGSPLRRLLVDNFVACAGKDYQFDHSDKTVTCHEFFYECLKRSITVHRTGEVLEEVWKKDRCIYHQHPGKPEGYSCSSRKLAHR